MLWSRSPTSPTGPESFWYWLGIAVLNIATITILHLIAVILLTFYAHALVKLIVWAWHQWS